MKSAAPGARWSGSGADAYADTNDRQARTLGKQAELDQRLGSEVDRSAWVVVAGRRDLDAVRQWVTDAAPVLSEPQPDPMATGACKAVLDQQVIFGTDVDEFRAASYGAATDTGPGQIRGVAIVTQAIGRFPSTESARSAFDRLAPAIEECNQLQVKNYEYDVHNIDGSTLSLHSNVADIVDRVDGATLVHVSVVGLPHSGRIAKDVAQRIGDRIP